MRGNLGTPEPPSCLSHRDGRVEGGRLGAAIALESRRHCSIPAHAPGMLAMLLALISYIYF